jgi:hypothetical protein
VEKSSMKGGFMENGPLDDLLVGGCPTPLKNMTSSVGMIIPNIWKVIKNDPNRQPDR